MPGRDRSRGTARQTGSKGSAMSQLTGHLLIAVPDLVDPNFFRSAVLIFQHSEEGAAGVVLNRPLSVNLSDATTEFTAGTGAEVPLYWGGPVQGPLMALHSSLALAEVPVIPGVFLSVQRANIEGLLKQSMHPFRLYAGYSGWGAQQLESELENGGWLTLPANPDHVFADGDSLWKDLCEVIGGQVAVAKSSRQPEHFHPSWN